MFQVEGTGYGKELQCCVDCVGSASGSGRTRAGCCREEQERSRKRAQDLGREGL